MARTKLLVRATALKLETWENDDDDETVEHSTTSAYRMWQVKYPQKLFATFGTTNLNFNAQFYKRTVAAERGAMGGMRPGRHCTCLLYTSDAADE